MFYHGAVGRVYAAGWPWLEKEMVDGDGRLAVGAKNDGILSEHKKVSPPTIDT